MDADGELWDKEDQLYCTDSYSDDSPILSHRYERRRYAPYIREGKEEIERRSSTLSVLAKFFLFSSAMILFCVLMYIPVYNKAYYQMPKGIVQGWSMHTNRDTKLYVQPNNVTTVHQPINVCYKHKEKLFLLIVVCSSTDNFERRQAIRDTWGNYNNYIKHSHVFQKIKKKYEKYNYERDLYPNESEKLKNGNATDSYRDVNATVDKIDKKVVKKRDLNGFSQLLPELARALKNNLATVKTNDERGKSEEESNSNVEDEPVLPEFDMNDVIGDEKNTESYSYDYESNVMKIPPKGEDDYKESNLDKILKMLKHSKYLEANLEAGNTIEANSEEVGSTEEKFKLVFLLGLPAKDNNSKIQNEIETEFKKYGDVLQEGFIDSYNNLTLKSIMMLKWVTNQCRDNVRYVLKSDDDMYINVPNLMQNLRNRSKVFDDNPANRNQKEYLLIGDLISGARPVLDATNKWYSPRYMYGGRVYPRYLSGTAYALSAATAAALYGTALTTTYFHLEDIYITGLCALRSTPRMTPMDDPLFSYAAASALGPCWAHAHASAHRLSAQQMRAVSEALGDVDHVDKCERRRLTQVRRDRMRPKTTSRKKLTKVPVS